MHTINDMLHIYALKHNTELFGMLQDYRLDSYLSRETMNGVILTELGDRLTYFNDTDVLKFAIDNWFDAHVDNITRLINASDPDNYDPFRPIEWWEDMSDKVERDIDHKTSGADTTKYGKDTKNTLTGSQTTTGENVVNEDDNISAYNAGMQPQANKVTTEHPNETLTYNGVVNDTKLSGSDVTEYGSNLTDIGTDKDETMKVHHYGRDIENASELAQGEINLARFNIYHWIADELGDRICLGVF